MHHPLPWRNRDFGILWLAQLASQSPTRMFQIALAWWLVQNMGEQSGLAMGAMLVLAALPPVLLPRHIGRLVDRSNTRHLLIVVDTLAAATALLLWALWIWPEARLVGIFATSFVLAALQCVIDVSLSKAVAEVVDPKDLATGVTWQSTTQPLAQLAGAVAGAALIDLIGVRAIIAINAFSFLFSSVCDFLARFRWATPPPETLPGQEPAAPIGGWRLFENMPQTRRLLIGFGLVNFFSAPIFVIMPLFTQRVARGTATLLATFEFSFALAMLLGSFGAGLLNGFKDTIKLASLLILAFGLAALCPAFWPLTTIFMATLFIMGLSAGLVNVRCMILFQETIPADLKGRFFALLQATTGFSFPIAFFLFGFLADHLPVTTLCLLQGLGVIATGLWFRAALTGEFQK
jgi:MFS family permease